MVKSARFLVVISVLLLLVVAGADADYVDVWIEETSGTLEDLNDVCAVSDQVAWAVGDNGVIRRRNVSGTWEEISVDGLTHSDWDFHGVFFLNANLGFVVGGKNEAPEVRKGIVLKTTDGGDHWSVSSPAPPGEACPETPFYDVYFASTSRGWISAGHGYILWTGNGGGDWNWVAAKEYTPGPSPDSLTNCFVSIWAKHINEARAVEDNRGITAKTTDGGLSWTCQRPNAFETEIPYSVPTDKNPIIIDGEYANADIYGKFGGTAYVALSEGNVGKSEWSMKEVAPDPVWLKGVWTKGNHVYAVGTSGAVYHSTNNGTDWYLEYQDPDLELNDVHFASSYTTGSHFGWAVGTNGTILRDSTRVTCSVTFYIGPQGSHYEYNVWWCLNVGCSASVSSFKIYRQFENSNEGGPYDWSVTIPYIGQRCDTLEDLTPGCNGWHYYYFWVEVRYTDGWVEKHGPWRANHHDYTSDCDRPPTPSVSVSNPDNDQGEKLHLEWNDCGNFISYYVYRLDETDGKYKAVATLGQHVTEYYDYNVLTGKTYDYHVRSKNLFGYTSGDGTGSGTPLDETAPGAVTARMGADYTWYNSDTEVLHFEWEDLDDPTFGGYWICPEGEGGPPDDMEIANTSPPDRTFYTLEGDFSGYKNVIVGVLAMDRSRNMINNWTKWQVEVGSAAATSCDATAYNNGRRLCYDLSSWHETYWSENAQGSEQVCYKHSTDGFHWSDKEIVGSGQNPSMALNSQDTPCVVWRQNVESLPPFVNGSLYFSNRSGLGWGWPNTLYTTRADNAGVGPPSFLVTDQNIGFVTWEAREQTPGGPSWQDVVFFGEFNTVAVSPQWLYFARIDVDDMVSTSDPLQASPSVALDLTGQPHVVWTRKEEGEIYYSYRTVGGWSQPQNVSESSEKDSRNPRISLQGDWLRVVWEEEGDPGVYKTYFWDSWKDVGMSQTHKIEIATGCLEPVIDGNVISMTKEIGEDYEIYASVFDHNEYSWDAGKNISNCSRAHSRYSDILVPIRTVSEVGQDAYYFAMWTEGGGDHYWLRFTEEIVKDLDDQPYYAFNLGQGQPSPVTEQRDGFYDFGPEPHQKVDYDTNNVKYNMNLEPQGFEYRLGLSYYHESQGTWYEVLKVDDVVLDTAEVPSGQRVYVEEWVPESAILDGNIVVEVLGVPGNIAHCGELRLYQYLPGGRKCGPLSTGKHRPLVPDAVRLASISPNPFAGRTAIQLEIPNAQKVTLRVYDTAGRLVKTLLDQDIPTGLHTVAWDGMDDRSRTQPSGVYFIRLSSDGGSQSEKAILLR